MFLQFDSDCDLALVACESFYPKCFFDNLILILICLWQAVNCSFLSSFDILILIWLWQAVSCSVSCVFFFDNFINYDLALVECESFSLIFFDTSILIILCLF